MMQQTGFTAFGGGADKNNMETNTQMGLTMMSELNMTAKDGGPGLKFDNIPKDITTMTKKRPYAKNPAPL